MEQAWYWAAGAAALGVLGTLWSYLRVAYDQVVGRMIVTLQVQGYQSEACQVYLRHRFQESRFGPRSYIGWLLHVRPMNRTQLVAMEVIGGKGRLFWSGWRPLWVARSQGDDTPMEAGKTARDWENNGLTLTFVRGTFAADQLIQSAATFFNQQMTGIDEFGEPSSICQRRHKIRYFHGSAGKPMLSSNLHQHHQSPSSSLDVHACLAHRPLEWRFDQLGSESPANQSALEQLMLTRESRQLVHEARFWRENETWYRERRIPWKRGWLLYGEPGTGKTAITRSIAQDLDLPLFVFDLASMTNEELQTHWFQMLSENPCLAVIEDIDAVFHGRKNVAVKENGLTFDCLLNCLDGIQQCHGLLIVLTTNHIEKVDPALGRPSASDRSSSTRPGRIDRALWLGPLDKAGRQKLSARILKDLPDLQYQAVAAGDGETAAQFQERCSRMALQWLWKDPGDGRSPEVRSRDSKQSLHKKGSSPTTDELPFPVSGFQPQASPSVICQTEIAGGCHSSPSVCISNGPWSAAEKMAM